jgi:hypothetical protein
MGVWGIDGVEEGRGENVEVDRESQPLHDLSSDDLPLIKDTTMKEQNRD